MSQTNSRKKKQLLRAPRTHAAPSATTGMAGSAILKNTANTQIMERVIMVLKGAMV